MINTPAGLGAGRPNLVLYLANRPVNSPYSTLNSLQPLASGELACIVANNSNHWRKVFNVYAKLLWQLEWAKNTHNAAQSWQCYRDNHLLQAHSFEALYFSAPSFDAVKSQPSSAPSVLTKQCLTQEHKAQIFDRPVHVIAGKTYAATLNLPPLTWLDRHFAINKAHNIIVSPYLDYRQLTNARIEQLAEIIQALSS